MDALAVMFVRGKRLRLLKHAVEGMEAERPPLRLHDIASILEDPDYDDTNKAFAWTGRRTVFVYYQEDEEEVVVRSVSSTRSRLAP